MHLAEQTGPLFKNLDSQNHDCSMELAFDPRLVLEPGTSSHSLQMSKAPHSLILSRAETHCQMDSRGQRL